MPEKTAHSPDQLDRKWFGLRPWRALVTEDLLGCLALEDLATWKIGKVCVIKFDPMMFRLCSRKALSCWLVAALLWQSLMPAIAGLRSGDGGRWTEVCASSGVKWVQTSDVGQPQVSHAAADHCVLCAATGAARDFDVRAYLSDAATDSLSLRRGRTPVLSFSAFQRRSRAPPSFS